MLTGLDQAPISPAPEGVSDMATIWAQPPRDTSRREISRAGDVLIGVEHGDLGAALDLVNRWRAAHAFPLNSFQVTLRDRVKRHGAGIVTQRLKRLEAILIKLERFNPQMRLAGVQDLGGCRAVVSGPNDVYALRALYAPEFMNHEFRRERDYIQSPKEDGYRAVHVIYRYAPTTDDQEPWRGLEIEIQLRSLLQHAWATAVETVDFFAKQKIKIGIKEGDWARFFVLMGNALAERERQPLAIGVPSDIELRREINDLARSLAVVRNLQAWGRARKALRPVDTKKAKFFLVQLDTQTMRVSVKGFTTQQQKVMEAEYVKAEREIKNNPARQAVLVGAQSIADLKRGYASFLVEPHVFIHAVNKATTGAR
jgi:RelA/SpoT family protein